MSSVVKIVSDCYNIYDTTKECEKMTKVYLDNCCYNRPYDDQEQILIQLETQAKIHIQDMIKTGKLELVTSFILWYELSQNPFEIRKSGITDFIRNNSSLFISSDSGSIIKNRAESIMTTGVKMKDAYHIACAIEGNCDYLLTTDMRMLNANIDGINIVNPIDFIQTNGGSDDE